MDSKPVVLLAHPSCDNRDLYREFLEYAGMSAIAVSNGPEALRHAMHADVIVTAIRLPGISGLDLIAQLRGGERTKNTPVIVLTALAFPADRERAVAAGCDVFLPLPCSPSHLLDEIRRLLNRPRTPSRPSSEQNVSGKRRAECARATSAAETRRRIVAMCRLRVRPR